MPYRDPAVTKRALQTSAVVGTVLGALNHGPLIVAGDITRWRLIQIGLSFVVPYLVSVTSSAWALRTPRRPGAGGPPAE